MPGSAITTSVNISGTAIYGSGLTNGVSPSDTAYHGGYGTGLFDSNRAGKVKPSAIFNPSAGYTFVVNGRAVRPRSIEARVNGGF